MKRTLSLVFTLLMISMGIAQAKFTVVALPDTQKYAENVTPEDWDMVTEEYADGLAPIFAAQTQWIVDHNEPNNIQFVCHLGDIVEHGPDANEWAIANAAMQILDDANMPYNACLGNHDNHYGYTDDSNVVDADFNSVDYLEYFGPSRFEGKSWYKGASPSQRSSYQVIEVEGRELLFLNLSIDTPKRELDWAQVVLDQNRDKLAIVSTHRYVYDFRILQGHYGDGQVGTDGFDETGLADEWYDLETVWPEESFHTFICSNKNIIMILCGHCHGQYYQITTNDWGLPVAEVLTDYQDGINGGNGWLRLMEFDFEAGQVDFSTYSPTLDRQRTVVDDFMETLSIVNLYKDALGASLGMSTEELAVMMAQLQADVNDYTKDALLEAYMQQATVQAYLKVMGMNYAWDGLWMQAFAAGQRHPDFSLSFDFDAYTSEINTSTATTHWEDGETVLGFYGDMDANTVTDPVFVGDYSLCLTDQAASGTPQAYVAWINGLQDGDEVTAGFWCYDVTPGDAPSGRIWGHYTNDANDIQSYAASAGGNSEYGSGEGWDHLMQTWTFDSNGGERSGLVIEARTYSNAGDIIWIDDLSVTAPAHATITLPE